MNKNNLACIQLGWVRAPILEQLKGITYSVLNHAKHNHEFIEGKHWRHDSHNRVWWNYEAIDEWIERDA